MKKRTETTVIIERPESYPKTPECDNYMKLREKHENAQGKRAVWDLAAAVGGTSGLNNAVDNEEFRRIQYAYHDCQMTAFMFYSAKKEIASSDIVESKNELKK